MSSRRGMWGLLGGLGLLAAVVAACGGGSSSNTGPSAGGGGGSSGGSSAVIQGQIVRSQTAALRESAVIVVLRSALGVGLAEAAVVGDPVAGATVQLVNSSLVIVATTTTDSSGNFQFTGVAPGTYTIRVLDPLLIPQDATSTASVTVGAGDIGTIVGTVTVATVGPGPLFAITSVHVVAANVNDLLQNDAQVCHAISIATAAGVNPLVVIKARQAGGGHGWGQIAHQFGVPPSVLGNNQCTETQISDTVTLAGGNGKGKGKGKGKGNS